MDWSSSGIRNSFEFEAIDPIDLDTSYGPIDGIVGGTITESYSSDYRSSCSLDCDGADIPLGCLIRIWHIAELDGEIVREELGTFMQDSESGTQIYGRYEGTLDMYSTMLRLGTDIRAGNRSVAKGTNVVSWFGSIVRGSFGTPHVLDVDPDKTFARAHTWESSQSVLSECHACADALDGYIRPDGHGRTVLEPYVNPRDRAVSFSIDETMTLPGVEIARPPIVNRVVMTYDWTPSSGDTVRLHASASVDPSHPWHCSKIGRWATEDFVADELNVAENASKATVQGAMDKKVAQRLREASQTTLTYSARTLYMPIAAGQVGIFEYEGISARVLLSEREIQLTPAMLMSLTLQEV